MLGSLRSPLSSFLSSSPFASSSRHVLAPICRSSPFTPISQQVRFRQLLAPKRTKYKKSMKGFPIACPTGGSIRGTTLYRGDYGLRILAPARLTGAQLTSCREALRRKIKSVKGAQVYLRVFPAVPVCVKGNEVRMGKGKGSFEFWACRVPTGRVVVELGGGGIRLEIARAALKLVQAKLPVPSEFITIDTPPRLGSISSSRLTPPPAALPLPRSLSRLSGPISGRAEDKVQELSRQVDVMSLHSSTKPSANA